MGYNTGKMGVAEGIALIFISAMPRMFLTTFPVIIGISGQSAWLTLLFNQLVFLIPVFMLLYIYKRMSEIKLLPICKALVGQVGAWIIHIMYSIFFMANAASLLRQYSENTLITALPSAEIQFIVGWYLVVAGFICYLGIEAVARTGYILLPFLVGGMLMVFLMLSPFYVPYHLLPWQGNGLLVIGMQGFIGAGYNLVLLIPVLLASSFQNSKTVKTTFIYGFLLTVFIKLIYGIVYIMVFGTAVGEEKSMPFFEMTRLVYFGRYIQHIESLFIILWVFFGVLSMAINLYLGLYLMVKLLKLPALRPLIPITCVFIGESAMLPSDINTVLTVDRTMIIFFDVGVYIIPLVLFLAVLIYGRRVKPCVPG